ncbi:hypothetical protein KX928_16590 [Roseobacter sp. YSTF-M11]|uniref:Uncharacterized protein n=1 Tax=Roseobacter insulae TaxID=2859783 RepID=A0A9X1JZK6_9RHOB|nr:hypothetical protein [Roseobacter insulae]MBW4709410.1 hypothetical protein [Roseobacter insulae]
MSRRWILLLFFYGALMAIGWGISGLISDAIDMKAPGDSASGMIWVMALVCMVYMLASAIPFVPGAEIGLALIAVFGARVALLVYVCMICALSLSFIAGRLVPAAWLSRMFRYLKFHKAAGLVEDTATLSPAACEARVRDLIDNRFLLALLSYRHIALAVAINVPGNTVLGGGGGLALIAGMSRLFSPLGFVVTLMIAVAPIPLTVFMMGYQP